MNQPPLFDHHFPSFVKETYNNQVDVYWYNRDFSQSRYPPGQEVSEACTLICLLVAQRVSQTGLLIWDVGSLHGLNIIIAEAICEGNATHAWILRRGLIPHPYLNTAEALKYGGRSLKTLKEWKFRVYYEDIAVGLYRNVKSFLHEWYENPKSENLFMLLITCGRTILFIFQEQTYKITLFDSHGHSTLENPHRGLVIAQTTVDHLGQLCEWYVEVILNDCYNMEADQYELAFLYDHRAISCGYSDPPCECRRCCKN
ncbi:uncharacterized protein LOC105702094 [Orussus abietinus]|uniref:uncharacterized protein LOC105702094 n=1 Tax=Orussus abietinus TaxID=222816 RepID=UPI0006265D8A|nr:uncharacterized protein LOC105702094 [Orussus abietinus]